MSPSIEPRLKALESQLRQGSPGSEHQPHLGQLGALLGYCPPRQYTAPQPIESTVRMLCSAQSSCVPPCISLEMCLQAYVFVPRNSLEEAVLCLLLTTQSQGKVSLVSNPVNSASVCQITCTGLHHPDIDLSAAQISCLACATANA